MPPERLDGDGDLALVGAPLQRVRKAYEQVHDQLHTLIVSGELARGQRLPTESALARDFGVSRGTVREALRVLTSERLIRTAKGAGGGSFVTMPTADHLTELLEASMGLLGEHDVSLTEFFEMRELLEVFAAGRAAQRSTPEDLDRLRATIMQAPTTLTPEQQFVHNGTFHSALVGAAHNTLLSISARPIFQTLQANLQRRRFPESLPARINEDHKTIIAAIEVGDAAAASRTMREHMSYLEPVYHRAGVWQRARER